jgi:hypothetical protein
MRNPESLGAHEDEALGVRDGSSRPPIRNDFIENKGSYRFLPMTAENPSHLNTRSYVIPGGAMEGKK